jgi:hypothetical protein
MHAPRPWQSIFLSRGTDREVDCFAAFAIPATIAAVLGLVARLAQEGAVEITA